MNPLNNTLETPEELSKLLKEVDEIKAALLGNQYHQNGVLVRLEEVEKLTENLQNFKNRLVWQVTAISSAVAIVAAAIKEVSGFW